VHEERKRKKSRCPSEKEGRDDHDTHMCILFLYLSAANRSEAREWAEKKTKGKKGEKEAKVKGWETEDGKEEPRRGVGDHQSSQPSSRAGFFFFFWSSASSSEGFAFCLAAVNGASLDQSEGLSEFSSGGGFELREV